MTGKTTLKGQRCYVAIQFPFIFIHLIWTGDSVMGQLELYSSGPFGSDHTGEWFSDWWQSLDGHTVKPQHWPDQINIRAGGRIDA